MAQCPQCLDQYFRAPGPEATPGAPPTMTAIEAACPVSYAACEEEDGCMFIIDAALHGGGPPRRGSDVLMAFVDCITGGGDMGASISTNPLSTNDKCPATCLPPQDTATYSAQLSEDNPTGVVLLPYDVDGVGWAILTLRQGVTCESCASFHGSLRSARLCAVCCRRCGVPRPPRWPSWPERHTSKMLP